MNDDMTNDSILAAPMATLRAEMEKQAAPTGVEDALMQAFAQAHPARRWYHTLGAGRWRIAGGLTAAALALLVLAIAPQPAVQMTPGQQSLAALEAGGEFIALDSLDRIEREPAPRMVETELPRTALAALGVEITPENAGESVKAEMLVAANGDPLAVRLTSLN
jgi:hypothetical protein